MKVKVVYHSRTGNTKKVAEAIAEAAGVAAEQISESTKFDSIDLLFIGDGIYGGKIDVSTENLLKNIKPGNVKKAVVFGTYGSGLGAIIEMKELLKKQGIKVAEDTFSCKGRFFFFFNRKHLDESELNKAKKFAQIFI